LKRKNEKGMIDLDKKVSVVHLNVGSGYITYLQEDEKEGSTKVKGIVLEKFGRKIGRKKGS